MSNFLLKLSIIQPLTLASSLTHNLQILSFSSSSCLDRSSFTVNYLINSCGLTPKKAISASRYVNFQVADRPNSVLALFKDHGFTQTQISKLVYTIPRLLMKNPNKTLLPKFEFLKSKDISGSDIAVIVSRQPGILERSLESYIIPSFNFFSDFFQSNKKTVAALKRSSGGFWCQNAEYIKVNIEILKQAGTPIKNIKCFVMLYPDTLLMSHDRFKQIIEVVKNLGFNPSRKDFLSAFRSLKSISKSTLDRKVEVYKEWGWSEDDINAAFRKFPNCMNSSEKKITLFMEYWINKLGLKSSLIAQRPQVLSLSLEKRIVPRCEIYQFLVSKGVRNKGDIRLVTMLCYSEKCFVKRLIDPYKEEIPELIKLYTSNKVESCKLKSCKED